MPLFSRRDGLIVRDTGLQRRMLPFILQRRNDAVVYFEHQLDMTETVAYLEQANRDRSGTRLSLFHLVLAGIARTMWVRPEMNRFVSGYRLYHRNTVELSFVVKKQLSDQGVGTTVKVAFARDDTLDDVVRRVDEVIAQGRGSRPTQAEREMGLVGRLPVFLLRWLLGAQRWLDQHNLLPYSLLRHDPLYCSVFLANLGSVGLDAVFHHLYEYGNTPLFAAVGQLQPGMAVDAEGKVVVRPQLRMHYTFEDRITDGFYAARSLDLLHGYLEHPAQLERPPAPAAPGD